MIEPSGILVLDKRAGVSSARAIAEVKRTLNLRKIGHAGTLDPAATGILICLINKATKSAKIFEGGTKCYEGTMQFGLTTRTDDLEGEVLTTSDIRPTFEEMRAELHRFTGEIDQVPASVSAIKVNGERAYDLVRKQGIMPELKSRRVTISEFIIEPRTSDTIWFRVTCSSGTYIRSLARDLGEVLGCGGVLATLRRVGSAPFTIAQSKTIEEICDTDIIPVETILNDQGKETACHLL